MHVPRLLQATCKEFMATSDAILHFDDTALPNNAIVARGNAFDELVARLKAKFDTYAVRAWTPP